MSEEAARDARFMAAALRFGARGLGETAPNPSVGCVIVDASGAVISRARTARDGRPHAEAMALDLARAHAPERLHGATAYVTLEPCAHHGKTPPCADALAAAGVRRVVSALEDPDLRVAGRGHARLREAGVAVTVGVGADAAREAHAGHLKRVRDGLPFLTLKLAATIDGRIATAVGESQWITSAAARRRAHLMRAEHDAVMVGIGTAIADDPRLNVRIVGLEARKPVRVVLDSRARLSVSQKLVAGADADGPIWALHGPDAPPDRLIALHNAGVRLLRCAVDEAGRLDARTALRRLADEGLTRVFCEGGGALAASLLAGDLVDRMVVAQAGLALGGDAWPAVGAMRIGALASAPRLKLARAWAEGPEAWTDWRRVVD